MEKKNFKFPDKVVEILREDFVMWQDWYPAKLEFPKSIQKILDKKYKDLLDMKRKVDTSERIQ